MRGSAPGAPGDVVPGQDAGAPADSKPYFTIKTRRGFGCLLRELAEDTDHHIMSAEAPWIRRYKGTARGDVRAALAFMLYHARQAGTDRPDFYPPTEVVPRDDPNQARFDFPATTPPEPKRGKGARHA